MEGEYGHHGQRDKDSLTDLQWFFAKSKVSISLAFSGSSSFLSKLKKADILSEEEALELKADTRSVHHRIYECLCCIEAKNFPLQHFFEHLFQKSYVKKYPGLKPIFKEYKEGKYRERPQVTTDMDKDRIIFSQDKVKICLAITDLFPFIHGLQDLTILSEIESLKLQADRRPTSRIIYECLSLIGKKDIKLSTVFEYIFQECYLQLYPGLQEILKEPCEEQLELFTGLKYGSDYAQNLFQITKTGICQAIDELFPFLYGLHDVGLLSRLQLLKLQADKRPAKYVLYKALCLIENRNDIEALCAYVFSQFYLNLFPQLRLILERLNEALLLDTSPSDADLEASPEQITAAVSNQTKLKPALKQSRGADNTEPLSQNVSPEAKRAYHKSSSATELPQKRPLAAEQETQAKLKLYRCYYGDCKRVFSDNSKYKIHRSKHKR